MAEKAFGTLPVSPKPNLLGPKAHPKQDFIGSEVRVRDDNIPTTPIAVAVEGVSWSSPDYYPMLVMQSIFVHSALHHSSPHVFWTSSRYRPRNIYHAPRAQRPQLLPPCRRWPTRAVRQVYRRASTSGPKRLANRGHV
ncbi:hypothetical protein V8E52_005242 [Russula decolorans]